MMRLALRCATALTMSAALGLVARTVEAQAVRGIVVDAGGRPLSGVVTLLIDSAQKVTARVLSTEQGEFRLTAPRAGRYHVRTLRIGFRPTTSSAVTLAAGNDAMLRIVLDAIPVGLDTIRVADRSACNLIAADSATAVFSAWEQARGAIIAAKLTTDRRGMRTTTIAFERLLDPATNRIRQQSNVVRTENVREPWRSLAPDSLRRLGYVVPGPSDLRTYYAPGLDMLLSPAFVEDHCFRIGRQSSAQRLALEFEPTAERRKAVDIQGTLWVDRKSSELRVLEFKYTNIPSEESQHAGGELEFSRLANGAWVISRWAIRMPQLERAAATRSFRGQRLDETGVYVAEVRVTGGTVTTVVDGKDSVWSRPPVTMMGRVADSASRRPVPQTVVSLAGTDLRAVTDQSGRFSIAGVLPGAYDTQVRTPELDSLNAAHVVPIIVTDSAPFVELSPPSARQFEAALCGKAALSAPGIVVGNLLMPSGEPLPAGTRVTATWIVRHLNVVKGHAGSNAKVVEGATVATTSEPRSYVTRPTADGKFRLCGVPVSTDLLIEAFSDSAESSVPVRVHIPPKARYARADVPMQRLSSESAVFSGTVLLDSTNVPIIGAEVALPDLGRQTTTSETGQFRIADVPPGEHRVLVRRLGYGPVDAVIAFGSANRVERRVFMNRATTLESVRVVADVFERRMASFEDHRRTGLGHFITRAQIEKIETLPTANVLQSFASIRMRRGNANQAWVVSPRPPQSINNTALRSPDAADSVAGARKDCYARVYVDGQMAYSGRDGEPLFDVNRFYATDLEAVEYYAGASQLPGEYGGTEATCGALVLWTRRK